jgi:hypothetical protein
MSWELGRRIWKGGLVRKKLALGKRGEDGGFEGPTKGNGGWGFLRGYN